MIIAKPGTWFKAGTAVELIGDCRPDKLNSGIFCGIRICDNPAAESRLLGEEYLDEELCSWDEFEVAV